MEDPPRPNSPAPAGVRLEPVVLVIVLAHSRHQRLTADRDTRPLADYRPLVIRCEMIGSRDGCDQRIQALASRTGTAPIESSSGETARRRWRRGTTEGTMFQRLGPLENRWRRRDPCHDPVRVRDYPAIAPRDAAGRVR